LRKRKFLKSSSKWLSHLQWVLKRDFSKKPDHFDDFCPVDIEIKLFKNFVQTDAFCPVGIEDGESTPERK